MQFRKFGKLDWEVSALGFGCMRLPTNDGGKMLSGDINEREAIRMIRFAIDRGVNFVDSAYPYHLGRSEVVLGNALKGGYRDKVRLSTKSPVWALKKPEDFDTYLNEQLERLQEDHLDFYLFHGLGSKRWKSLLELDILSRAEAAVKDGRIGHIGFSFHDDYEAFEEIVDAYSGWAMCLIQHNYMDIDNQAGTRGLRYAASRGLAVAIMEPLLGGNLANPPEPVRELFDEFEEKRSPADLALQWLWDQPEVAVVLSGMSSMEQVEENVRAADVSGVGSLGARGHQLVARLRDEFNERDAIACTGCGYCMPCPNEVDIPGVIELYNEGIKYDDWSAPRFKYMRMMGESKRAGDCAECGECEEKCPQDIPISEWMPKFHEVLS